MSRTHHGTKGSNYEYWSRRPGNGMNPGRWAKTYTHRRERRRAEVVLRNENYPAGEVDRHGVAAEA